MYYSVSPKKKKNDLLVIELVLLISMTGLDDCRMKLSCLHSKHLEFFLTKCFHPYTVVLIQNVLICDIPEPFPQHGSKSELINLWCKRKLFHLSDSNPSPIPCDKREPLNFHGAQLQLNCVNHPIHRLICALISFCPFSSEPLHLWSPKCELSHLCNSTPKFIQLFPTLNLSLSLFCFVYFHFVVYI